MSMTGEAGPENSTSGHGLLAIFAAIQNLFSNMLTGSGQKNPNSGGSGHLGRRRAVRLTALLAPRNRLRVSAVVGIIVVAGAMVGALLNREVEPLELNNAIWLDRTWIYGELDDAQLREFVGRLVENRIGKAYAYVSSLGVGERWSGGAQGSASFMNLRGAVGQFVRAFKGAHDQVELYAWIEIWTHLDSEDGYRLDDTNLHQNVADFSRLLVDQLGFDGVLLDVKPMFSGNDDFIRLIRRIRAAVGVEKSIAIAVTADLTPHDLRLQDIPSIAPGTMWSPNFKQRVLVSADEVVLLLYQSYRQERLDYVNWVAYHIESYVDLLETNTEILASIPNYGGVSNAHNPEIETMAIALDGVNEGLRRLDEEQRDLLTGVAIYSDEQLSQADWNSIPRTVAAALDWRIDHARHRQTPARGRIARSQLRGGQPAIGRQIRMPSRRLHRKQHL